VISLLVFSMQVLIPGDPVDMMTLGQAVDAQTKEALRHELGLDRPVVAQYASYLVGLFRFDLGTSVRTRQPVTREIRVRYPNTLRLAFAALLIAVALGVATGVLGAVYRDTWVDFFVSIVATLGLSIPQFWLGLLLMFRFGVRWRIFPVMGNDSWSSLVLPSLTLGLILAAAISRMVRSTLLDVLRLDYVRTARAKGVPGRGVLWRHALVNALIPVITVIGLQLGFLLGGAFIVEVVFAFPGIGQLAVQAIQYRDFPVIQGVTLVVAFTTVAINVVVDVLYAFANPQIRFA
jgi:ABC-type dipeptide/oligopeptide/nickel transport system permease component